MKSFWQTLPKPFFVLAPMEEVTDTVFRQVIIRCGKPDVMVTEFTSVEGLASNQGHSKVVHRLQYNRIEKPLVAQIWGITPQHYYQAGKYAREHGFDGLDINMGCPVKKIIKQGACSALIKNPSLASDIIQSAKEGSQTLPVSVKTRIGFDTIQTEEWIEHLLRQELDVLAVHCRTVKDLSQVPARWEEMKKVVSLRDCIAPETLIIGNGDILSRQQGVDYAQQYGVDGIMIGRGVFHNPWVFSGMDIDSITMQQRIEMVLYHLELFESIWGQKKPFSIMKKFFKIYIQHFEGAKELRGSLMECSSSQECLQILYTWIDGHSVTI